MKYFLFDIGNVLTNFDFQRLLRAYADDSGRPVGVQTDMDEEMYVQVEKGLISEKAYVEYLNETKGLNWTTDNLHLIWQEIFSLNEVGNRLFSRAKASDAEVYTLSNIAHYHIRAIENNWAGFFEGTTGLFMSYKMGVRKPDPRIYAMVLEELGADAHNCFFIDDLPENIEAAKDCGIDAHLFVPSTYAVVEEEAAAFFDWRE
jgi:putative hydrolase of the HAD superfamily